ncbi:MAG: enoyl-CoA hydratase, partial [Tabrizicola sp.]|nr:enoyl-CoA hydratase [Tabrizicola sp.]
EKSAVTAMVIKECVNRAQETSLQEGVLFERRMFHAIFATEDQKEGMAAFLEKRQPQFRDK